MFIYKTRLLLLSYLILNQLTIEVLNTTKENPIELDDRYDHVVLDNEEAIVRKINSTDELLTDSTRERPNPRIVIVGATGSGKSSLANALLGRDPQQQNSSLFRVCSSHDSCTKEISEGVGNWLGNGERFTVVDTPGFGDSDLQDGPLMRDMTKYLKDDLKEAHVIVLLLNTNNQRFSKGTQEMLRKYSTLFGAQWWKHMVIAFSFFGFDNLNIQLRELHCRSGKTLQCKDERWLEKGIQGQIQKKFHLEDNFTFAFPDSFHNRTNPAEVKTWETEADKIWEFANSVNEPMEFKGVDDILEENIRQKREIGELKDWIAKNITELNEKVDALNRAPVGTIVAWLSIPKKGYIDKLNQNRTIKIPDGWVKCDGNRILAGDWKGFYTPNLNGAGEKRFLRGAPDNDNWKLENDMVLDHKHEVDVDHHKHDVKDGGHAHKHTDRYMYGGAPCACNSGGGGQADDTRTTYTGHANIIEKSVKVKVTPGFISGSSGRKGSETRPKNMCITYIIRVW